MASPGLPVGAYSYSEAIETLVAQGIISDCDSLQTWLLQELHYGTVRIEALIMLRAYYHSSDRDIAALNDWNTWLSASRETAELRQQSWQMGQSLLNLLTALTPSSRQLLQQLERPCNYALIFGIACAWEQIAVSEAVLGYLQSWATNLINVGIKCVPLGQTMGQILLRDLQSPLMTVGHHLLNWSPQDWETCGWGLALASMNHQTQYTRLFRS